MGSPQENSRRYNDFFNASIRDENQFPNFLPEFSNKGDILEFLIGLKGACYREDYDYTGYITIDEGDEKRRFRRSKVVKDLLAFLEELWKEIEKDSENEDEFKELYEKYREKRINANSEREMKFKQTLDLYLKTVKVIDAILRRRENEYSRWLFEVWQEAKKKEENLYQQSNEEENEKEEPPQENGEEKAVDIFPRRPSFEEAVKFARLLSDSSMKAEEINDALKTNRITIGDMEIYLRTKTYFLLKPLLGIDFMREYDECLRSNESYRSCFRRIAKARETELKGEKAQTIAHLNGNFLAVISNGILLARTFLIEIQRGGLEFYRKELERKREQIDRRLDKLLSAKNIVDAKGQAILMMNDFGGGVKLKKEDVSDFIRFSVSEMLEKKMEKLLKERVSPLDIDILKYKQMLRGKENKIKEILFQFKMGQITLSELYDEIKNSLSGNDVEEFPLLKGIKEIQKKVREKEGGELEIPLGGDLKIAPNIKIINTQFGTIVINPKKLEELGAEEEDLIENLINKKEFDYRKPFSTAREYAHILSDIAFRAVNKDYAEVAEKAVVRVKRTKVAIRKLRKRKS